MKVFSVSCCAGIALAFALHVSQLHAQGSKKTAAKAAASPSPSVSPSATPSRNEEVDLPDTVATVNGEKILKVDLEKNFDAAVQNAGIQAGALSASQKLDGYRRLLDGMIIDKLVKTESADVTVSDDEVKAEIAKIKSQFPSEDEFKKQLATAGQNEDELSGVIKQGLQQQRWIEGRVSGKDAIGEAEAKGFYDQNRAEFEQPETVKASHILFMVPKDAKEDVVKQKEAAAKAAAARAKKGEDFDKLAKELSEEPGAKERGGELGYFSKERMVPEFSDAAFKQKVGEISDPVRTEYGFHIIKVEDKKPAGTMSFEEVKPQLEAYLKETKRREAVNSIIKQLRDGAKVEILLPPPLPPSPAAGSSPSPSAADESSKQP